MELFQSSDFYTSAVLSLIGVFVFYLINQSFKTIFRSYLILYIGILVISIRPIFFEASDRQMVLESIIGLSPMLVLLTFIHLFYMGTYKTKYFLLENTPTQAKSIQRIYLKSYRNLMYIFLGLVFFVFFILSFLVEANLAKYFLLALGLIGTFINIYLIVLNRTIKEEYLVSILENKVVTYQIQKRYILRLNQKKELLSSILVQNEHQVKELYHVMSNIELNLVQVKNKQLIEPLIQTLNPYEYVSYKLIVENNQIKKTYKLSNDLYK